MCVRVCVTGMGTDCEDPYPSLSDYHDYEPNLEFDDTELQTTSNNGETSNLCLNRLLLLKFPHNYTRD